MSEIKLALAEDSGIGMSLTAVRAESVEGNDEAAERTMDWTASESSWEGGWAGGGAWKRSGFDLSKDTKMG